MWSQFDSNILQLPTLPGRILVPPVTQVLGQNGSIIIVLAAQSKKLSHLTQKFDQILVKPVTQLLGLLT